jgi:toxin ParE1/3/4
MGYSLSAAAIDDLRGLYRQGLTRFGELQADRYYEALLETLSYLAEFPEIARKRNEFTQAVRIHRHGAHVIIYTVDKPGIVVVRIRHGHEDWSTSPIG